MASPPRSLDAYFLSSDVDLQVKLLVLNLHGACPALLGDEPGLSYAECISRVAGVAASDLYISCQLHTHGRPFGLPERTCNTPGSRLRWNEWVGFNAKYRDLSPDAHVTLTLVGSSGPRATRTLGTARLALFDEAQQLRMGVCKMQVRMCSGLAAAGATDGGGPEGGGPEGGGLQDGGLEGGGLGADQEAELGEIEAASARHEASLAQPTPGLAWLDRPTYTYLETRRQALDSQLANPNPAPTPKPAPTPSPTPTPNQALDSQLARHFLFAQLPDFEFAVLHHDPNPHPNPGPDLTPILTPTLILILTRALALALALPLTRQAHQVGAPQRRRRRAIGFTQASLRGIARASRLAYAARAPRGRQTLR